MNTLPDVYLGALDKKSKRRGGSGRTVKPFLKSLFSHFANVGILAKWLNKVF